MPKNEDIQKIFSDTVNSPSDKVIHMSVINSFENFDDAEKSSERERHKQQAYSHKEEDKFQKDTDKGKSNKAAVPILDFTQLPSEKERKKACDAYDDLDFGSNSIGSIFDQESHLDLSSKRMKKLILTSDFSSLLNLREEALKHKADKEKAKLDNLITAKKISPRTGKFKALKLEKWITKEKEDIKKTKKIIEEAKKKTEDVIKQTQENGEYLKHILSEKVATPRDGFSIRSGMNSARRRYEQNNREFSDQEAEGDKLSSKTHEPKSSSELEKYLKDNDKRKNVDEMIEKYGNKEIDFTKKEMHEADQFDMNELVSAETPKVDSDKNSDFLEQNKVMLGPQIAEGDSSRESSEPIFDKNRSIKLSKLIAKDKDSSDLPSDFDPNLKGLSRKKSEQNLKSRDEIPSEKKLKDLLNPPSKEAGAKTTTTPTNPFNSDNFFTQNFDDQEMEEAIEKLKNSSGKMGINSQDIDSTEVLVGKEDREEVSYLH